MSGKLPPVHGVQMPAGFEPIPAEDVERLSWGKTVSVLECASEDVYRGTVLGVHGSNRLRVEFGNKHIEAFYLDDPDFENRGPAVTIGEDYMLVRLVTTKTAEPDLLLRLELSNKLAEQQKQIDALTKICSAQQHQIDAQAERTNALYSLIRPKVA